MLRGILVVSLLALAGCQTAQSADIVEQAIEDCQLEGEGRPDQAQLVYDSCGVVIEQSNESDMVALAYNNRSLVHFDQGRDAAAIEDLNRAIALRPDRSAYFHNRGRVYSRQGESEKANADFNEALRLDPDNMWALNNYAWHLAELGDYAAAWPRTEKAVALDPASVLFTDTKAHVLMGLGRTDEAEAAFAEVASLGGEWIVQEYQAALEKKGYNPGRDDGVFDDATQAALSDCIRDNCRLLLD